jgi:3-oxoadipate enol-lactonase
MPSYERDGLDLVYTATGSGDAVLSVHGATGNGVYEWGAIAAVLEPYYRVIMPDLRGHGGSAYRADSLIIEEIEKDLLALMGREKLTNPHIMGFSFGSEVSLWFELDHPGTAKSLVLLSPGLGSARTGAVARSKIPSREQLSKVWPQSLRDLHRDRHGPDHWVELMQELWLRHAERPLITQDQLASITCPVLLVCGSKDDQRRIRQADEFAEANSGVRLARIDGAHHPVHMERPDEVQQAVLEFLRDVDRRVVVVPAHGGLVR